MKLWFSAALTAFLVAACFNLETITPGWVALALWLSFVLGTFFGIEGYKTIEDHVK